jgi:hypothetical protein
MKQRRINSIMLVFVSLLVALPVGIGTHGLIFFIQQSRRLLRISPIPIWYIWVFFTAPIVIGFVILFVEIKNKSAAEFLTRGMRINIIDKDKSPKREE